MNHRGDDVLSLPKSTRTDPNRLSRRLERLLRAHAQAGVAVLLLQLSLAQPEGDALRGFLDLPAVDVEEEVQRRVRRVLHPHLERLLSSHADLNAGPCPAGTGRGEDAEQQLLGQGVAVEQAPEPRNRADARIFSRSPLEIQAEWLNV